MRRAISIGEGRVSPRVWVPALAAAFLLSGCGESGEATAAHGENRAEGTAGSSAPPFAVTHNWRALPPDVILDPRFKTWEQCVDQSDRFNKWRPDNLQPISTPEGNPYITVDGSCNSPLNVDKVGVYTAPSQDADPAETSPLPNGTRLDPECAAYNADPIQDVRGGISRSDTWIGYVGRNGDWGFIPATNAGYPNTAGLPGCP